MKLLFGKRESRALEILRRSKRRSLRGPGGLRRYGLSLQPLEDRHLLSFSPAPGSPYPLAPGTNPEYGPALGDFYNDGRNDIVTPNFGGGNVTVLFGNPDGSFTPGPTTPTNGTGPI